MDLSLSTSTHLILYADDNVVYKPIKDNLHKVALQKTTSLSTGSIQPDWNSTQPKWNSWFCQEKPHPAQPYITIASHASNSSHLLQVSGSDYIFQSLLVSTHWQHMCQSQEITGYALLILSSYQQGGQASIHFHCAPPICLLCLCLGPSPGHFQHQIWSHTEVCYKACCWPLDLWPGHHQ